MKNKNLISIHGKIGSGKDTITKIIQILAMFPTMTTENIAKNLNKEFSNHIYENKKFAEKVKQILCILTGCKREDLESQEFKDKPMGVQWNRYAYYRPGDLRPFNYYPSYADAEKMEKIFKGGEIEEIVMTYRLALQLIGTDLFRNIFHENTWVSALFAGYILEDRGKISGVDYKESKWIISDLRFSNEFEAIKVRKGYQLKVIRLKTSEEWLKDYPYIKILDPDGWDRTNYELSFYHEKITQEEFRKRIMMSTVKRDLSPEDYFKKFAVHESELALNSETRWDYVILNDGSVEELIEKVRLIFTEISSN